jgi:hypothetical protein
MREDRHLKPLLAQLFLFILKQLFAAAFVVLL